MKRRTTFFHSCSFFFGVFCAPFPIHLVRWHKKSSENLWKKHKNVRCLHFPFKSKWKRKNHRKIPLIFGCTWQEGRNENENDDFFFFCTNQRKRKLIEWHKFTRVSAIFWCLTLWINIATEAKKLQIFIFSFAITFRRASQFLFTVRKLKLIRTFHIFSYFHIFPHLNIDESEERRRKIKQLINCQLVWIAILLRFLSLCSGRFRNFNIWFES